MQAFYLQPNGDYFPNCPRITNHQRNDKKLNSYLFKTKLKDWLLAKAYYSVTEFLVEDILTCKYNLCTSTYFRNLITINLFTLIIMDESPVH